MSNIVAEICRLLEITKYTVQPLDQKANGLAKQFMATLANSLTQYISANQDDWCEYLPFATFAYNSVEQRSVGDSPFFLMYPRIPFDNLLAHRVSTYAEDIKPHDSFAMNFQFMAMAEMQGIICNSNNCDRNNNTIKWQDHQRLQKIRDNRIRSETKSK